MGGNGGGGLTGGAPGYIQDTHANYLDNHFTIDYVEALEPINNPWVGVEAYDPATETGNILIALQNYTEFVDEYSSIEDLDEQVEGYRVQIQNELDTKVLPQFRLSMRDVGGYMTSNFVTEAALLQEGVNRKTQEHRSNLLIQRDQLTAQMKQSIASLSIEINRMILVANTEYIQNQAIYDEAEAMHHFTIHTHAANFLSAHGAGQSAIPSRPNRMATTLGGALSGAATGAMIGSPGGPVTAPMGAAIGAAVGGLAGFLQ